MGIASSPCADEKADHSYARLSACLTINTALSAKLCKAYSQSTERCLSWLDSLVSEGGRAYYRWLRTDWLAHNRSLLPRFHASSCHILDQESQLLYRLFDLCLWRFCKSKRRSTGRLLFLIIGKHRLGTELRIMSRCLAESKSDVVQFLGPDR